ncbi:MAG: hypothetical protein MI922_05140, partial [Bacteroidales bacterium]|nr:hypothetical protein [Bacteroidales bacterium]
APNIKNQYFNEEFHFHNELLSSSRYYPYFIHKYVVANYFSKNNPKYNKILTHQDMYYLSKSELTGTVRYITTFKVLEMLLRQNSAIHGIRIGKHIDPLVNDFKNTYPQKELSKKLQVISDYEQKGVVGSKAYAINIKNVNGDKVRLPLKRGKRTVLLQKNIIGKNMEIAVNELLMIDSVVRGKNAQLLIWPHWNPYLNDYVKELTNERLRDIILVPSNKDRELFFTEYFHSYLTASVVIDKRGYIIARQPYRKKTNLQWWNNNAEKTDSFDYLDYLKDYDDPERREQIKTRLITIAFSTIFSLLFIVFYQRWKNRRYLRKKSLEKRMRELELRA